MVTFGDAISLLVTFFVMLVSFADYDEHALQDMAGALKGGLRAVPLKMATLSASQESEMAEADTSGTKQVESRTVGAHEQKAKDRIYQANSPDYYLNMLRSGVSVVIKQASIFERGTATISVPDHEALAVVKNLQHYGCDEIEIIVTLPDHLIVRMEKYTTAWGLGIEMSLAVREMMVDNRKKDSAKISTAIRVVKQMPAGEDIAGIVEIRYVGVSEDKLEGMPGKILRGTWQPKVSESKELNNG